MTSNPGKRSINDKAEAGHGNNVNREARRDMSMSSFPSPSKAEDTRRCLICYKSIVEAMATTSSSKSDDDFKQITKIVIENILKISPNQLENFNEDNNGHSHTSSSYSHEMLRFCETCMKFATAGALHHAKLQIVREIMTMIMKASLWKHDENDRFVLERKLRNEVLGVSEACSSKAEEGRVGVEVRGEKRKWHEESNEEGEEEEEIVKVGYFPEPITITVLEKEERTKRQCGSSKYYYFLVKEDQRDRLVEAWAFFEKGASVFERLEVGFTYTLKGHIKKVLEVPEYLYKSRKSELKWKYIFNDIEIKKLNNTKEDFNPGVEYYPNEATRVLKLGEFIARTPRKFFQYRLVNGVKLASADIYRYTGCRTCQKARPKHVGKGFFRCVSEKCGKRGRAGEILETFMMICNMTIKNPQNGAELGNIVCFNDVIVRAFKKKASEYKCDEDVEADLQKILNSRINLRLSCKPLGLSGCRVIADYIEIVELATGGLETDARAFSGYFREGLGISGEVKIVIKDPSDFSEELLQNTEYKLESSPSGYLLLLNIFRYENAQNNRNGAKMDFLKLFGLFTQLDFQIFGNNPDEPLHLQEISDRIEEFKKELVKNDISSFAVIVMGHGRNYNELQLSDGKIISVSKEIMEPFSSENFPEFFEKPKIFMFNMCRGFHRHEVVDDPNGNSFIPAQSTEILYPDIQNAYISYSALPGHLSFRDSENGSFFVDRFVTAVKEYVKVPSMDLKHLFTEVEFAMNKERRMIPTSGYEKRLALPCEHKSLVFRKFKFNVQTGNHPSELGPLYAKEMEEYEQRRENMMIEGCKTC